MESSSHAAYASNMVVGDIIECGGSNRSSAVPPTPALVKNFDVGGNEVFWVAHTSLLQALLARQMFLPGLLHLHHTTHVWLLLLAKPLLGFLVHCQLVVLFLQEVPIPVLSLRFQNVASFRIFVIALSIAVPSLQSSTRNIFSTRNWSRLWRRVMTCCKKGLRDLSPSAPMYNY